MDSNAALVLAEFGREVAVLHWPAQRDERDALAQLELPRLLLVEPGTSPPACDSCLEDWARLPIDNDDIRSRLTTLTERAARHRSLPLLDSFGQLSHRGRRATLSPIEEQLFARLVREYGRVVPDEALIASAWPAGGGSSSALRVHLSRLRRRLLPLGLEIRSRRGFGHFVQEVDAPIGSAR